MGVVAREVQGVSQTGVQPLGLVMERTLSSSGIVHSDERLSLSSRIGFVLIALALVLLPLERLLLPAGLRVADLALVLVVAFELVSAWLTGQRLVFPLLLPMWLILCASLIATLLGLAHPYSLTAIVQEIYLYLWFLLLTNVLCTFSLQRLDQLLKIWSLIACVEAATALMGALRLGPSLFYTLPYREQTVREGLARAVGTFNNPNAVAMYLGVSFFALLATSWPVWGRTILGAWLWAGMFATGSNGALASSLVALFVLVAVYSILKDRRQLLFGGAMIGLGVGFLALLLLVMGASIPFLSALGFGQEGQLLFNTLGRASHSLLTRASLLTWSARVYSRYPLGTGPNSFSAMQASLHNDYVAFLFERGPAGLIGWLWLIGATLLMSLRTASRAISQQQRWAVLALGAGFVACALNAAVHEISHMRQVWMLMAFLYAMSYIVLRQVVLSAPTGAQKGREVWMP